MVKKKTYKEGMYSIEYRYKNGEKDKSIVWLTSEEVKEAVITSSIDIGSKMLTNSKNGIVMIIRIYYIEQ